MGPALGDGSSEGAARHAEKRLDEPTIQRRQTSCILWGAVIEQGFLGQSWLTFRQALSLGGHVRKGERGTTVVYADRFVPNDERQRADRDGDEPHAIPFLKRFTVFNIDQCEGLPESVATSASAVPEGLILPRVEALIGSTGADLRIGGNRAYYDVVADYIRVPPPQAYFESSELAPDGAARTGPLVRGSAQARARSHRPFRFAGVCKGRAGRRNGVRFPLRYARHRAHSPPRRLYRRVARGLARRQPCYCPSSKCCIQGR